MSSRRVSLVLSDFAAAFSFCTMVWAWFIGGMGCDEVCSESGDWTTVRDAAEWDIIVALGVAVFAVSLILWVAARTRHAVIRWALAGIWSLGAIPLMLLLDNAHGQNGSTYLMLFLMGAALVIGTAGYGDHGHDGTT